MPGLAPLVIRDYPTYTEGIPDQYRYQMFKQQFAQWQKNNNLPDLTLIQLNADHTAGSAANFPTPRAMVADNDLAVGKIVDEISHSKYWKDSAIFVTEDDSQAGDDHVDGHRTTGYAISPWTKTGGVDSSYYTQVNMVRTIEQILGLPPMNQMDLATPMSSLFTTKPNFAPYDAVANKVPLDEMNPGSTPPAGSASTSMKVAQATGTKDWSSAIIEKQWLDASNAMGFNNPATPPDATDRNLLNHVIWYATEGYDTPYPGEPRVLAPNEVPRVEGITDPEEQAR